MTLTNAHVGTLPDGFRGIDANQTITPSIAEEAYLAGYEFVMRYVRRAAVNGFDLSENEMDDILVARLSLGLVQHVAPPGWMPTKTLGSAYGWIASGEAHTIKVPLGVTIFCDLEGVSQNATAAQVVTFANAWHAAVSSQGYHPGLYIGWHAGLTGSELDALAFDCYWGAYNLNADQEPPARGLAMRQSVAKPADWAGGMTSQTMDVNTVLRDKMGGSPHFLIPTPSTGVIV